MKIIVRAPNWVGDAVLSTPALSALRKKYPTAHISLLARSSVSDCFLNNPAVDEIITLPQRNDLSYWLKAFKLRREKYDMAVLFPNSFASALFFYISGAKEILGYRRDGRRFLLSHGLKPTEELLRGHQINYYLNLAKELVPAKASLSSRKWGMDSRWSLPRTTIRGGNDRKQDSLNSHLHQEQGEDKNNLHFREHEQGKSLYNELVWVVTEEEKENAKDILKRNDIDSKDKLIGISPGAAFGPAKRWFPERYAEAASELVKKHSVQILLFGTVKDKEVTNEICRYMEEKCVNLAGETNLRQLASLLSMCKLLITNDSGTMHIACAVRTPVVAIFGSTDPVRTGPTGEKHTVLYKKLDCSPCFARKCPRGDYRCFKEIEAGDVYLASEKQLNVDIQ